MRSISANALAKIQQAKGTEPILIVEVDWGVGGGPSQYADRDVEGIDGRILEVGALDNVVNILHSSNSQQLSLVLDDTDGQVKSILDTQDIHQRDVRVYQYFSGLNLSDKFLIFSGKISSTIRWSAGERTLSFSVVSQLEDKEFGFSVEEGEFSNVPRDLVGKPWPVIFGTALDVPALQVNKAVSGSTLCGVGILSGEDRHNEVPISASDCSLGQSIGVAYANISFLNTVANAYNGFDDQRVDQLQDQANELRRQVTEMLAKKTEQDACASLVRSNKIETAKETGLGCNPVRILGGEDFPQNEHITLNIGGGLFDGSFNNDVFTIIGRRHPENEDKVEEKFGTIESAQCATDTPAVHYDFSTEVPPGRGDFLNSNTIRRHGFIICNTQHKSKPTVSQVAEHFWADAGSRVTIHGDEPIYFIVSITPGTVLDVKAFKQLEGVRRLVNVPTNLWEVETRDYGPFTVTFVKTTKPLSSIEGQGWEDQIHVTFESDIGPNTVDILKYIIDKWTDLSYDSTSFDAVETKVNPFPMNFAVLARKNTLEVLQELAFQARCAIWVSNGTFYLKYLPEEPTSDQTVSVSDIEFNSVELTTTPTEQLVTKLVANWRMSYAEEDESKIILRHNVKKYGTKEREIEFYAYNNPDIVLKAATFWLIRWCNTWKRLKFRGFLNLLNLETFDTVNLDLGSEGYVSNSAVKAIVEKADYDSDNNTIDFECLVPIKFGEMVEYEFFWPSAATGNFPTVQEIRNGLAGGDGIGATASGALPVGTAALTGTSTVIVGGPNVVFNPQSDRGDRTPYDTGFVVQDVIPESYDTAELDIQANPNPDLTLNYVDPIPDTLRPASAAGVTIIDIRKTKVVDSDNPGVEAFLDTIIRSIESEDLVLDTEAKYGDGTNIKEFDFKYDLEGEKFGAGTAFLKDD